MLRYGPLAADFYEGPVRAVAIHPSRPLLVTGGDDYKIKVWGESMRLIVRTSVFIFPRP